MRRSVPSATRFSTSPVMPPGSCGPVVRGLIRLPASRSIGAANSAIVGMLRCSSSSSHCRSGDVLATGNGGASRMSTTACGGVLYGVCAERVLPSTARQTTVMRRIGFSTRNVGYETSPHVQAHATLLQRHDEPHADLLGGLWTDTAGTIAPDNSLDPVHLGVGDARDVAVGDLEHLPVDDAIAHGPSQQPVMRIDLGEPLGNPALQLGDRFGRGHTSSPLSTSWRGGEGVRTTAAALRRIPR